MSDFFGLIGKESSDIGQAPTSKLNNLYRSGSFHCYYSVGFDLSVYENDHLFVISLGYLSSFRSNNHSTEHSKCSSCAISIANLYSSSKHDFYNLIDGNFSFCIFDKVVNTTILARDKLGSRPLYICFQEDHILFSSNQKLFLDHDSIKLSLDKATMANYLALKSQKSDKTFFNEIKRVAPFSLLLCDNNLRELSHRRYAFLDSPTRVLNPVQEFKLAFENAIKRCWSDARSIGLMFSGGLDSSAIAAGLRTCGYSDIQSFSCNYSHLPEDVMGFSDETEFQKDVIKKLRLSHTKIELRDVSPLESIESQFKYFAEPAHFPNLYMFEQVASEAKSKKIQVIFDGQDGDSVISHGLERMRELAQMGNIFLLLYELVCYSKYNGFKLRNVSRHILGSILRTWGILKHDTKNTSVLNHETFEEHTLGEFQNFTFVDSHLEKLSNPLHHLALETKYLIFKYHGIHARSPFYDKDLMEFCLNIPSKWKLRNGKTRFILREYLSRVGLGKISQRRKKANLGYGLVDNIRRLDLKKFQDELEDIHPFLKNFINQERINEIFIDFKTRDRWDDPQLMGILAVFTANYWLKNELNFESISFEQG